MALSPRQLRRELQHAGIANAAIDAVWPQWWSDDASQSVSATAELTYTVARRLGLSPRALFDGSAQFLWRDDTKFKKLDARTGDEEAALASFGIAVGRCALGATPPTRFRGDLNVQTLRDIILGQNRLVSGPELINVCWSLGIPVLQLRVLPLRQKRMHAMTVRVSDRYAILLGFESRYFARIAYILAHELGHVLLGHLEQSDALLEVDDPLVSGSTDAEETEADRFALKLLTGQEDPRVISDVPSYSASQVADAARTTATHVNIDPGVLALCLGHATKKWDRSIGALKIIPPGEQNVGELINNVAAKQLNFGELSFNNQEYLARILGRDSVA